MTEYTYLDTPIAPLLALSDGERLTGLYFRDQRHLPTVSDEWKHHPEAPLFKTLETQLGEFMLRNRREFTLPLRLHGTEFQKAVWEVIRSIPFGSTLSYTELASRVGRPNAIRAVGTATGRNPICWIIPCHRVIGKSGALTGYAGGLPRKIALLNIEQEQSSTL